MDSPSEKKLDEGFNILISHAKSVMRGFTLTIHAWHFFSNFQMISLQAFGCILIIFLK